MGCAAVRDFRCAIVECLKTAKQLNVRRTMTILDTCNALRSLMDSDCAPRGLLLCLCKRKVSQTYTNEEAYVLGDSSCAFKDSGCAPGNYGGCVFHPALPFSDTILLGRGFGLGPQLLGAWLCLLSDNPSSRLWPLVATLLLLASGISRHSPCPRGVPWGRCRRRAYQDEPKQTNKRTDGTDGRSTLK